MEIILVSTDFSSTALNAAKYAAQLSSKLKSKKIIIYHSYYQENTEMVMVTDVLVPIPGDDSAIKEEALNNLEQIKTELTAIAHEDIEIELITDDRPLLKAIKEIVQKENVDIVVGGMHGAGDEGRNSVGKHTANLIKNRKFSFLVIPANVHYEDIKIAVLACDLREISESIPADQIKEFINKLQSKLIVVNVEHTESRTAAEYLEEETELHSILNDLNPEFHYIDHKNTIEGIFKFTKEQHADLLVAVPKELGFIEQLFHESATKKLAVNTPLPLLLFHNSNS